VAGPRARCAAPWSSRTVGHRSGSARPSYFVLGDLLAAAGEGSGFWTAGQTFDALAAEVPAFAGLTYDGLGLRGAMIQGALTGATA